MSDQENDSVLFQPALDPNAGKALTLRQRLLEAKQSVGYVQKLGWNENKKFRFTQGIDVRKAIKDELFDRRIDLQSELISSTQRDITTTTEKGYTRTVIMTEVVMLYTFIDVDNPSDTVAIQWKGWGGGSDAYNAYGAYTSGQRHFLDSNFMLLSGEKDPEAWNKEIEAEAAKIRGEEEKFARSDLSKKKGVKIVGGPPHIPTVDELADSDASKNPPPEPMDESWRVVSLKMCKGLDDRYKGVGTVGSISLQHLIDANRSNGGFVSKVQGHVDGYKATGHKELSNALISRLMWEIDQGNIEETVIDGKYHHEIVQKK